MTAPMPGSEAARRQALRRLAILDTPEEARFDRITRLAARMFGTSIALVSLVDGERQWFKSTHGLDVKETARDASFCSYTITNNAGLVIEDARQDPRFAGNPLVLGPPHIRFYAGEPLRTLDNFAIGTLCLIGFEPRSFSAADQELLRTLADCVESEINISEARTAFVAAQEGKVRLQTLVDNISDALIVCSAVGCIESCNPAAEKLFGYESAKLLGANMRILMLEPYYSAAGGYQLYMADYAGQRFVTSDFARCANGSQRPIERRVDRLALPGKELHCHLIRDVSERREFETTKTSFLAAAAHELRSPLASIYGFAELLNQRQLEPARQRQMLGIMYQQAGHMTRLINGKR